MSTLEELKQKWGENRSTVSGTDTYDRNTLEKIFKSRVKNNTNAAMQYFWASFALQLLVYALFSHVIIKYWSDPALRYFSIGGILLYIPFTIMLMNKFKRIARAKLTSGNNTATSLRQYLQQHRTLLLGFYNFKKRYEFFLIPISCAIGVILTFKLYVPGGVDENQIGALITFIITLFSCVAAIRSENKKSFQQPLHKLQEILDEFNEA